MCSLKNICLLIVSMMVLAFMFTGCGDIGETIGWEKEITDLVVNQGTNSGELTYSFSATIPPADTYTLYYAENIITNINILKAIGTFIEVEPTSIESPKIINGLKDDTTYSVVVIAVKGDNETNSDVKTAKTAPKNEWTEGLTNLVVQQGTNPGELTYSFIATDPEADTYTLYYIEGTINDTDQIIADGISILNASSPGIISDLKDNTTYSFVVVAEKDGFEEIISDAEQAITAGVWTQEVTDLEVELGTNPGELTYSFSATNPVADTYTLYYIDVETTSIELLTDNGTAMNVTPTSAGTITGLKFNTPYSVIVVAKKDNFKDAVSDIKQRVTALSEWEKGLDDLAIQQGSIQGQLNYSFTATNPAADTYTLYYVEGENNNVAQIMSGGNQIQVIPSSVVSPGIIPDLKDNTTYSVIIVARKTDFREAISVVEQNITRGIWIQELTDLEVQEGTNSGELNYSFSATNPVADSYTLYYMEGTHTAAQIMASGTSIQAAPTNAGTITDLTFNTNYSIVIVAAKNNFETIVSDVEQAIAAPGKWEKGLTDLVVEQVEDLGELMYSFSATDPMADSYTLYYAEGGNFANAQAVIDAAGTTGIRQNVSVSGTITGLKFNTNYSIVIVAAKTGFENTISNVEQAVTALSQWEKGLDDLDVKQGTSPGELMYSFSATYPAADTYTLYYVEGEYDNYTQIMSGNQVQVMPMSAVMPGTIPNLKNNTIYSIVVIAEKADFRYTVSAVRQATTAGVWIQKLTDLEVKQGENPGQLTYSFSATDPVADTYTLYYAEGEIDNASQIIANGENMQATPASAASPGIIFGLKDNTTYSVVIIAKKDNFEDIDSNVDQAITAGVWERGVTDLAIQRGTQGTLTYSFSETNPVADTYTLYYVEDVVTNKAALMEFGTDIQVTPTSEGTITGLKNNTNYSIIIVAKKDNFKDAISDVNFGTTLGILGQGIQNFRVPQGVILGQLVYSFGATDPEADSYTLYYIEGEIDNAEQIIANGTSIIVSLSTLMSGTITGLKDDTTYSFVVVAEKDGFLDRVSEVVKAATGVINVNTNVSIQEIGLNTMVTWSFERDDLPFSPESDIILTYNYRGLPVVDGKLQADPVIFGTETITLANNVREYTIPYITHGGLVAATDIVVSLFDNQIKSTAHNTSTIELRLYNVAYAKAKEYGAIEMFSYAKSTPRTALGALGGGGNVHARGHQIINFDSQGNGIERYNAEFSRGELTGAAALGNAAATNIREVVTNGTAVWARSSNGANQINSSPSGDTTPVTPTDNFIATTVASDHEDAWDDFQTQLLENPFALLPYNVNRAFTGFSSWKYPNPVNNANTSNSDTSSGRIESPNSGRLTAENGLFEFSIVMTPSLTDNQTNIVWAGNQTVTSYANSIVTFIIDENFRFVKYHAFDRYSVSGILTATTNTTAAMYFVYHKNNVTLQGHRIYRPHQTRPTHVNFVSAEDDSDTVIAPFGNTSEGNMVINNSRYQINLSWRQP